MSAGAPTPQSIISLDVEGRGFTEVTNELNKHVTALDRMEQVGGRLAGHFDSMASSIGRMAGVVGVGAVLRDFMQLEDVANRIADTTNTILTGPGGYRPFRDGLRQAAIATGVDSKQLGQAIGALQGDVGGSYLDNPATRQARARSLGMLFGQADRGYGISPGALSGILTPLELFGKTGVGGSQNILLSLLAQAHGAGMEGQSPLFAQTVSQVVAALGSLNPAESGRFTQTTIGALYGAAAHANPAFKDPATFAAGVSGIDSGLNSAYSNPRLSAALQMAGIGYWEQRGGLAGVHGSQMAGKLLRYADHAYGHGSIEEDLFLRSNFGDVSADMLRALASGKKTYKQLLRDGSSPGERQEMLQRMHDRARGGGQTPGAELQKKTEAAGHALDGPAGHLFDALGNLSLPELLGLGVGLKAGSAGVRKLGAGAANSLRARLAQRSAAAASDAAAAAAGGEGAETAGGVALSGGRAGGRGLLSALVRAGMPVDEAGLLAGLMTFGSFGASHDLPERYKARHTGLPPSVARDRHGRVTGVTTGHGHTVPVDPRLSDYPDSHAPVHGGASPAGDRFDRSVRRFEHAVDRLSGPGSPGMRGASYMGPAGGTLNAASAWGPTDSFGTNLILSRMLTPSGGGGANVSPASLTGPLSAPSLDTTGGGGHGDATVVAAANALGIPVDILWGVYGVETGFGTNVHTSSAGANGPFQFMPGTAAQYGVNVKSLRSSAYGAARYLRDLYRRYGSWDAALRHYSGGGYGLAEVNAKARQRQMHLGSGHHAAHHATSGHHSTAAHPGVARAAAMTWMSAPPAPLGAGDGVHLTVNLDGRKWHEQRALTRGRV